ncbi:MAG: DNA methyltransferase [Syntrophales bacterium]
MPALPSDLRNKLERVVIEARDVAEVGARAALEALAVHHYEPYPHMKPVQRELRNHLRARARQLGDRQDTSGRLSIDHLADECAYEHWHRMLFARFLAENNLLIEPEENMAISLAEAEELAKEEGVDVWEFASRCAQEMLPQIFRPDDPLLQVSFAAEHMLKLEKLLASLPAAVFTASDALGWVYQFWQSKKKEEVNRSEVKIGADEISAVTQLFTEPYMVEFLLHNTLGAWWAGKNLDAKVAANAKTEDELRATLALPGVTWDYLRFVRSEDGKGGPWLPAAGTFDGWPKIAKSIKGLDPCCGSGHFLVVLFRHLVPIRMAEEGFSTRDAVDAVLRDNLHGLEIDERCCQIAAFALALAAWTYPEGGGYRPLPELHIACTGIGPQATEEQWVKLAEQSGMPTQMYERERVKNGLLNLHRLFSQAPALGSLIDPKQLEAGVFAADYETIQPYLVAVLKAEKADDETHEQAIAAAGMTKAADLLAGKYTLVLTNVPYLGRGKQGHLLKDYCERVHPAAKSDLATCFVERCLKFCTKGGGTALVTPQNWFFLRTYTEMRRSQFRKSTWNFVARLGAKAFQTPMWDFGVALISTSLQQPDLAHKFVGLDVGNVGNIDKKSQGLIADVVAHVEQHSQLQNPDAALNFMEIDKDSFLAKYAYCYQGTSTGDNERFLCGFYELPFVNIGWTFFQMPPVGTVAYGGKDSIVNWQSLQSGFEGAAIRGREAWGKQGVAFGQMANLPATFFQGTKFSNSCPVLIPFNPTHLPAVWSFCTAGALISELRQFNQKLSVDNGYITKVPFNLAHWQKIAAEKYPDGLPEPESDDPTQWLFHGRPEESTAPLQVAVARLLGYRWPAELDEKMNLSKRARTLVKQSRELVKFADDDGIICIPAVRGEEPAAERLLRLLAACGIEPDVDLDNWLRNGFLEEHCKLFHDRPFVWHIWDGRKRDGFHALVNYHKLCEGGGKGRRLLESLTYAYLGEWITRQKDGVKRGEEAAEDRLAAALELQKRLEAILSGEPPFDIFVRWKPLAEQPIGWEPDINDGVRLNIRPFLATDLPGGRSGAGILRYKPNIKWTKDRGKEPHRPKEDYPWFWGWDEKAVDFIGGKSFDGNRWNDCHYTKAVKQGARQEAKK